jgi:hypothetical protein
MAPDPHVDNAACRTPRVPRHGDACPTAELRWSPPRLGEYSAGRATSAATPSPSGFRADGPFIANPPMLPAEPWFSLPSGPRTERPFWASSSAQTRGSPRDGRRLAARIRLPVRWPAVRQPFCRRRGGCGGWLRSELSASRLASMGPHERDHDCPRRGQQDRDLHIDWRGLRRTANVARDRRDGSDCRISQKHSILPFVQSEFTWVQRCRIRGSSRVLPKGIKTPDIQTTNGGQLLLAAARRGPRYAAGSSRWNVAPRPGPSLSAHACPLMASARARTIASPMPYPPAARLRAASTR